MNIKIQGKHQPLSATVAKIVNLTPFESPNFQVDKLGAEPYLNRWLLRAYRGDKKSYEDI